MRKIATAIAALVLTAGCAPLSRSSAGGGPGPSEALSPPVTSGPTSPSSTPDPDLPSSPPASPSETAGTATPGSALSVGGSGDLSTWNAWPNGNQPPLPHTTCGTTTAHYDGHPFEPAVMSCFAGDVGHCRAGSVVFTLFGVDSGEHMVATVQPATSPCTATVVATDWTANGGGYTAPAVTLRCRVSRQTAAVRLSCPGQTADWLLR